MPYLTTKRRPRPPHFFKKAEGGAGAFHPCNCLCHAMDKPPHPLVLVTGSTGLIGSWLVQRLLEKGYRVRAAARNPDDKQRLEPFLGLDPSLSERLEIVKADLSVEGDFDKAVQGCDGVFHLACAVAFTGGDLQKDVIDPAIQGTLNVLNACVKASSVKRVLHVSSTGAIHRTGKKVPEQVFDESCWTDVDFCIQNKVLGWPYFVGKTLGEKAAMEFGQKHNLDVVVANPSIVNGPFLLSRMPISVRYCLALITGEHQKLPLLAHLSYIHTDDIVRAFIFLYENPKANGRYICSAEDASITEVAEIIRSRYPEFKIPTDLAFLGEPVVQYMDSSKLKKLGFQFKYTLEDIFCDAIDCCKEKGLLQAVESSPLHTQ